MSFQGNIFVYILLSKNSQDFSSKLWIIEKFEWIRIQMKMSVLRVYLILRQILAMNMAPILVLNYIDETSPA